MKNKIIWYKLHLTMRSEEREISTYTGQTLKANKQKNRTDYESLKICYFKHRFVVATAFKSWNKFINITTPFNFMKQKYCKFLLCIKLKINFAYLLLISSTRDKKRYITSVWNMGNKSNTIFAIFEDDICLLLWHGSQTTSA